MKKLVLALIMAGGIFAAASARDTYSHDVNILPQAAQSSLKNNFKSAVSVIKIDKDFGHVSEYEVVLTDGTEITFDNKGNWNNVETSKAKSVPQSFVAQPIRDFVAKNQPGTHIVGIDKERSGYEVELSNGVDVKFDNQGAFVRYDK